MRSDTSIFRGTKFNIKIATRGAFQRKLFGEGRPAQPHGRFRHSYIHTQKWYGELDGGGGGPASRSLHTKINAVPPQLRRLTEVKDWSTDCIIDEMNLKSCEIFLYWLVWSWHRPTLSTSNHHQWTAKFDVKTNIKVVGQQHWAFRV